MDLPGDQGACQRILSNIFTSAHNELRSSENAQALSQATVAGIIGKWWELSDDEMHPLCSNILSRSLFKIGANSFGSVCLGGLIVMPCMTIVRLSALCQQVQLKLYKLTQCPISISRSISENTSRSGVSLMAMFQQACCTGCIKVPSPTVRRHVNQWSFTYIGLYSYTFFESGNHDVGVIAFFCDRVVTHPLRHLLPLI